MSTKLDSYQIGIVIVASNGSRAHELNDKAGYLVAFFVSYILCHTPRFSKKIAPIFCVIHIVSYTFLQ